MDFSTTLLREKFVIRDSKGEDISGHPITAVSNRMVIPLYDRRGKLSETFVVRAQTMHACIRMAAKIVQTYIRNGPIMVRAESFDFEEAWDSIVEDHERKFNPGRWVAVYNGGKCVFGGGDRHPFLDVVEKCDTGDPEKYDQSIKTAEDVFEKMGKRITIVHDGNIGLVVTVTKEMARCGLILRNPNKRTTFNFICEDKKDHKVTIPQVFIVAAAFLEGIQLAYQIGMSNERLRLNMIARYSDEERKADSGRRRLGRLNAEIKSFENLLEVRYRPERPEFGAIVAEAEKFARDLYTSKVTEDVD